MNIPWFNAYTSSFVILLIAALGWIAWGSIKHKYKIKSLFPLQQPPTMDDVKWIRSDLDRKELNIRKAIETHLIHGARYANEYRDLMGTLKFLDETIQQLNSLDWNKEILERLNEIYLYNSKKYQPKVHIKFFS